jgi:hypothetical protein
MQGFFFQFCDVAQVAITLKAIQPNLATCTKMEVEQIKISLYLWLPTGTNNKNLAIGRICFSKSGEFGAIFLMENPSCRSKSYFSGRDLAKIRQ